MIKTISAQTFTPIYDEVEDRLRLALNYDDVHNRVDFMITRNFILNLIPSFDEYIMKYYFDTVEVVKKSQEQANKQVSPTDNTDLALYLQEEVLLHELELSFDPTTKLTIINFKAKNTIATAQLDLATLKQVVKIIKKSLPYVKWGISHNFIV